MLGANNPLDSERSSAFQSSSTSLASQETFLTASSSTPRVDDIPTRQPTSQPFPIGVRKSISVDSFAGYRHETKKNFSAFRRKSNAIPESEVSPRPSGYGSDAGSSAGPRGKTVGTKAGDVVQRTSARHKTRCESLSGRSPSLPISPAPSLSSSHDVPDTSTAMHDLPQKLSIAVIGSSRCGKSSLIQNGLKTFRPSEPTQISVLVRSIGNFDYTFYTGTIPHLPEGPDATIGIMEVDTTALKLERGGQIWPAHVHNIEGAVVCYDASDVPSFQSVEKLLRGFWDMKLPTVVVACKSDLDMAVDPREVLVIAQDHSAGFVEVTTTHDSGKDRMHRCFDWLVNTIIEKQYSKAVVDSDHTVSLNDQDSPPSTAVKTMRSSLQVVSPSSDGHSPLNSPTRSRSGGDLPSQSHPLRRDTWSPQISPGSSSGTAVSKGTVPELLETTTRDHFLGGPASQEEYRERPDKDRWPSPWATLEQILDKLLFLAVSGDDPAYISHFLLTYRRFTNPRSVLLAMQKRMRQLDELLSDPLLACFAQLRICHLLGVWIQDYPCDFAVRGSAGALSAVVKSVISKSHLLHYAADLLPFLEVLPNLVDRDAEWALKADDVSVRSEDSVSPADEEDNEDLNETSHTAPVHKSSGSARPTKTDFTSRNRRPSLPMTAKALVMPDTPVARGFPQESSNTSSKHILKELSRICQELSLMDSKDVAQEITRLEVKLFLQIEPRHWLRNVFVSGKKDPEEDPVARYHEVSNHLAEWVVSLILCHDKPRARARQMEKLIEIATCLRRLQNYSALRAFVAGINNSTFEGDATMEVLKKSSHHYKALQSYGRLFQQVKAHQAYRMALKNTRGACVPALEVHLSDLIRTHEGNPEINPKDPAQIHWGKFNLMGKFIRGIRQRQDQCADEYEFPERPHIRDLLMRECLMDDEMQRSRITPPSDAGAEGLSSLPRPISREFSGFSTDPSFVKRKFFW